jgi:hypothetical protein
MKKCIPEFFILIKAWGHFKVEEQYGLILQHLSIFKHKYKKFSYVHFATLTQSSKMST